VSTVRSKPFAGFPEGPLEFLGGIRAHNTKDWFDAHRDEYEKFYVEPAIAFGAAVGLRLARIAPEIVTDARVNGSIFRINRDTRIAKDKRPYKDHLDFAFWEGERKASVSSFFVRGSPDQRFPWPSGRGPARA